MLKIKIPPRSEPEKTEAVPLKQGTEDNAVTQFRDWWQEEFEEPADFLEYDAGQLKTAVMLSEMVKDLVWPDFKVGARDHGSSSVGSRRGISHERKRMNHPS